MTRKLALLVAGLLGAAIGAGAVSDGPGLHLDHVPIAVRDLPSAIARFQALGFTADGSYLELITAHDAGDRLRTLPEDPG